MLKIPPLRSRCSKTEDWVLSGQAGTAIASVKHTHAGKHTARTAVHWQCTAQNKLQPLLWCQINRWAYWLHLKITWSSASYITKQTHLRQHPHVPLGFYKVIVGAFCIDQLNHCLLAVPLGFGSKSWGTEWFELASEAAGVILFYSRGHNLSCL